MTTIREYLATVWRALRSKTILTAAGGLLVHQLVKKGLIPDTFFAQALEGTSYVLCAFFRVAATTDLKTGDKFEGVEK